MTVRRSLFVSALIASLSLIGTAEAASSKPKGIKVKSSDVFVVQDVRGRNIQCAPIKRRARVGKLSRGLFYPSYFSVDQLKKDIKKARNKKKKAQLTKKLKTLTATVKANDTFCQLGPDPFRPLTRPMTEADVRHLYEKAALGAVSDFAISIGTTQGAAAVVNLLTSPANDPAVEENAKKWLDENFTQDSTTVTDRGVQLYALYLLLNQANPFHERFAFLFLHNLLSTSLEVLTDSTMKPLMVEHFAKIRRASVDGDYPTLLKQITRDPVMLMWLNGNQNTKQQPNENFARELMELFTIAPASRAGAINYSETTVAQVARACTGWTVQRLDPGNGEPIWSSVFVDAFHDADPGKVIFEGTPYQGVVRNDIDVINHILANHPNADDFLAERLLKEYLNETPSDQLVQAAAKHLKANGFNLLLTLRKILTSDEFYKDVNRNAIIKGPVERTVSMVRALGIPYDLNGSGTDNVRAAAEGGGQFIGMPPTVFGWDNPDWPNGQYLLSSANATTNLLRRDSLFTQRGFSYQQLLPHPAATDLETVNHIAKKLNVSLNPVQLSAVLPYMNNRFNPTTNTFTPDLWDPANSAKVRRKVVGLIEILLRTRDFQTR